MLAKIKLSKAHSSLRFLFQRWECDLIDCFIREFSYGTGGKKKKTKPTHYNNSNKI